MLCINCQMRIGITTDTKYSMFSSGHANSCIAIAEVFKHDNHEVVFLGKGESWWEDVESLKGVVAQYNTIDSVSSLDLILEVGFFLTPLERSKIGAKCIWYCRKNVLFTDLESTVYTCKPDGRDLEGLAEIWAADIYNGPENIIYLKTLYPKLLIKTVPWIWTPTVIEAYRKEKNIPVWFQVNENIPKDSKWSLRICETNMSNTSSCSIPLVIVKDSDVTKKCSRITIHNAETISNSQFFKENIFSHTVEKDSPIELVGRQRISDLVQEPRMVILNHSRFISMKQVNLEAVWLGIPLVHNNPLLKELGLGLEGLYYHENSIEHASSALNAVMNDHVSFPYLSSIDELTELRKRILYKYSPEANAASWLNNIKEKVDEEISVYHSEKKTKHVLFTDMWSEFNVEHNMFTLALEHALEDTEIKGYSLHTLPKGLKHDIHIFGPFGSLWKNVEGPKIHFTGENTGPINEALVFNIGFQEKTEANYLRMPLWMFELDWFGADLSKLQNPLVLPVETCSSCPYLELKREKFCAFIVSNPKNPIRNEAFHSLNKYKKVDSAGRLFNTVGDELFAGLGGGGGELKKHEFLKNYRFCLAYENEIGDGYVTEKLLHAKAAGCIPIYWGSSSAVTDFNPKSFINASECSMEEMVALVKEVEEDQIKWKEMASIPLFNGDTIDIVRSKFSQLVQYMFPEEKIPKLIGKSKSSISKLPFFVTCATSVFWPSLLCWLKSIEPHTALARIYVDTSITEKQIKEISKSYSFASIVRFPIEVPDGFPDFWVPQHYAWKLWILKTMSYEPELEGRLIFYMDCGSTLIRMPDEWIRKTIDTKISFLEDPGQLNGRWCHDDFCSILKVTQKEKEEKQLAACLLMFVSGEPLVKRFFSEAYKIGCIRKCIVGQKWIVKGDEVSGHRHDQSILSILSKRYNIHRYPLQKIYCDISERTTYYNGLYVYVHRGNYRTHIQYIDGIDDIFVINLDRRPDRRKAFLEAHPDLKGNVKRHIAYDGLSLNLTSNLASLFKPNDFFWKKAVMGCSLSHLKLWTMLLNEKGEIENYLILEDDVRFLPGWKEAWIEVYKNLPSDWECIYLGGVLPPNKEGFLSVVEPVLECPGLSRIKLNTFFGQSPPSRQFHFCTYSYILSRRGAKRLLDSILVKDGIWTSADHLLFNSLDKENVYVLNPLLAGASQDNDPAYINSDFNDFSRKDKFDSDLWNNNERFSSEEVLSHLENANGLDIMEALNEIPIGNQVRFISLDVCNITEKTIFEGPWLREFIPNFRIRSVSLQEPLDSGSILVIRRPMWDEQIRWIKNQCKTGKTFSILHMSDEFCEDPIHFYSFPQIKAVLRFYPRPELNKKVLTIPLGYHWQNTREVSPINKREYTWSFCGTNWKNRSTELEPLLDINRHYVEFYPDWNFPGQKSEKEFITLLLNTCFIPCPRGNNIETFRIYEALECGCIPVFTELPSILVDSGIPFLVRKSWVEIASIIREMVSDSESLLKYQTTLMRAWKMYKEELKVKVKQLLV